MSEDSLCIEFSSKGMMKDGKTSEFERIYRKYVPEEETSSSESSIKYKRGKAIFCAGFFDSDPQDINLLIQELKAAGANDVIARVWYDSVGEEMFFARINGEFLEFGSKDEMSSYIIEQSKKPSNIKINYGKSRSNNTVLVRLHVKGKSKRNKIFDLFAQAKSIVTPQGHSKFVEGFNELVKSDTHDIIWCKFKWKEDESWNEVISNDIIYGLVDVVEEGQYLYLAFDLDKLEGELQLDDFIYFVLFNLGGVKKIWIKYRPSDEGQEGLYLYHPGMGDESFFCERDLPDDNQWPK